MAKKADLFAEARGGVNTCVNKAERDNKGGSQHKSDSEPTRNGWLVVWGLTAL